MIIADSFNLELLFSTHSIPIKYVDLDNSSNSVIDLMFLRSGSTKLNSHFIYSDLQLSLDHVCCGNHQTQCPMISLMSKPQKRSIMWDFTRELDKEPLLNQSPIYTNVSWSVLLLSNPALQSMLHPHVRLTSYSRPPCVLHVP